MFTKEAILRMLNNPIIEYTILKESNPSEESDLALRRYKTSGLIDRLFNGKVSLDKVEPLRLMAGTSEGMMVIEYVNSRFIEV